MLTLSVLGLSACAKSSEEAPPQVATPPAQSGYPPSGGYAGAPGYGAGGQPGYGTPAPGYGQQQPGYGTPAPSASAPGQGAQPVPPLGQVGTDPNALQALLAAALAGGAAALGAVTGGELAPIEAGIASKAKTDAKGMTPEGQVMSAKLQQGAHAQSSLTLQTGKCYSIVGFGGIGVFDYQLNLITAPPLPPQVLAQSGTGRADPTLGPNEQCVRNPYPLPLVVNVDMTILRGQGLVGARAYVR
jgi:hypothetical protein